MFQDFTVRLKALTAFGRRLDPITLGVLGGNGSLKHQANPKIPASEAGTRMTQIVSNKSYPSIIRLGTEWRGLRLCQA